MRRRIKKRKETYFIKDEVLKSIADDEFGHKDFAMLIKKIIDKQETPFNIGIFGKWGVGKSSIISLYRELIEDKIVNNNSDINSPKKIAFVKIPVWKYTQRESLRNKFILKIAEALFINVDALKEKIYGIRTVITSLLLKPNYLYDELKKFKKHFPWKRLILGVLLATLAVCVLRNFYKIADFADVLAIPLIYFFGFLPSILKFLLNVLKSAKVKISYGKFDSAEQFENEFIDIVKSRKCKKIIFVDDLDRCSINKVVETLETIKTFLDIPSCIFIIACDNQIIEQAINESNKIYKMTEENDGAQYLEKFFQYTITIPPFIRRDMREYAKKLLKKQRSKLLDLPDIDDILFVLIHEDVINPRRAIVLINSFISNYLVAKKREEDPKSKLNIGMIINNLPTLAKIVVLKHDYPEFYSELEKNKDLIKWMTAYIYGEEKSLEFYQKEKCKNFILQGSIQGGEEKDIKDIQKRWDESYWLDPNERRLFTLYNFLSSTREYDSEILDMRPFIFLGQDSASYGIADEYLEKVNSALRTGQFLSIRNMLEKEKEEKKSNISNIMLDWIENDLAGPESRKSIQVLSECLSSMSEDVIQQASSTLINKTLQSGVKERLKILNVKGMFYALASVREKQAQKVLKLYIESLNNDDIDFSKKILDSIFEYEHLIESYEHINKVKSFLEKRSASKKKLEE